MTDKPQTGGAARVEGQARGRELGSLIGGVFGMVFVVVNSGRLGVPVRAVLVTVAGAALLMIMIKVGRAVRARRHEMDGRRHRAATPFGKAYAVVVLIEAVALFAGAKLLTFLGHPEAGVAWVSIVVGTHFFALGRIFGLARFHVLAVVVTLCGLAGVGATLLGATGVIPVVAGVLPGLVLLGFALWAMLTVRPARRTPAS